MSLRSSHRRWASCLVMAASSWLPAQAVVVDFDALAPGFYGDRESFSSAGYTFTVAGDFGIVDTQAACTSNSCPVGNSSQFYYGLNDGAVIVTAVGGGAFTLLGFDAAYLAAAITGAGVDAGKMVLTGRNGGGSVIANASLSFAPSTSLGFPFVTYAGNALSAFTNVQSLTFSACSYDSLGACVSPNANLGQFALDNVQLVPEPGSAALLLLGGAATAVAAARRRRPASASASPAPAQS